MLRRYINAFANSSSIIRLNSSRWSLAAGTINGLAVIFLVPSSTYLVYLTLPPMSTELPLTWLLMPALRFPVLTGYDGLGGVEYTSLFTFSTAFFSPSKPILVNALATAKFFLPIKSCVWSFMITSKVSPP